MNALLRELLRRAGSDADGRETDGALLGRFVAGGDPAAFEELLRRHGPAVWSVCRRALADPADAENAFQAVVVVFLTKAAGLRDGDRVGGWLHGVAVRTARQARRVAARRPGPADLDQLPARPEGDAAARDLAAVLDEELARLAEPYRTAVVLCLLHGHGRAEAARLTGWPEGTVASRVARGRRLLQRRLLRRGLGEAGPLLPVPAGLLDTAAGLLAAPPSAPVAALAGGVLAALAAPRRLAAVAVLLVALLAGAAGLVVPAGTAPVPVPVPSEVALTRLGPDEPLPLRPYGRFAVTPDGRFAVVESPRRQARLVALADGAVHDLVPGPVGGVAVAPDAATAWLALEDGTAVPVALPDRTPGRAVVLRDRKPLGGLAVSPDGTKLAWHAAHGTSGGGLYDLRAGKALADWPRLDHLAGGWSDSPRVAFTPDGKAVAFYQAPARDGLQVLGGNAGIVVWDVAAGKVAHAAEAYLPYRSPGFAVAGQRLVTVRRVDASRWEVHALDLATGRTDRAPAREARHFADLVASPSGRLVAEGDFEDDGLLVFEPAPPFRSWHLGGRGQDFVGWVALGKRDVAVLAAEDGLALWDAAAGRKLADLPGTKGRAWAHVALTADGTRLVGSWHESDGPGKVGRYYAAVWKVAGLAVPGG